MADINREPIPETELQARHETLVSHLNTDDNIGVRFQFNSVWQAIGTIAFTVYEDGRWSWIQDPPMSRRLEYENVFVPYVTVWDNDRKGLGEFFATESYTLPEHKLLRVELSGDEITFTVRDGKEKVTFKKR
ncbi:hypothetical protein THAR02_01724 [Trichoderma harzianum]|uniref:Uncharacterized protein n=1 Tax=Trichoderma harzianum TaxID=5544 RepID=A0A0F9XN57_TRIHA|nr:hypothetical protein THAR02_01724 [Trichoderma harzianum]